MRRPFLAILVLCAVDRALPQSTPTNSTTTIPFVDEQGNPISLSGTTGATPTTATTTSVVCMIDSLDLSRTTTPSSECMTCHDGSKAIDARTGHKFDILYASTRDTLRPKPEQFNPKIVLVNNTITCLTCHDPASTLDRHAAAPLDGPLDQRLCVACHIR